MLYTIIIFVNYYYYYYYYSHGLIRGSYLACLRGGRVALIKCKGPLIECGCQPASELL